jgi:hypothetical protein
LRAMEIPVRIRQTRTYRVGWESLTGFKCQVRSTSTSSLALSPRRDANLPTSSIAPALIDRAAIMRHAHKIARDVRPFMPNYAAALQHGLRASWGLIRTRREFAEVRARVKPRVLTPEERRASEHATRRCGASYMPF